MVIDITMNGYKSVFSLNSFHFIPYDVSQRQPTPYQTMHKIITDLI